MLPGVILVQRLLAPISPSTRCELPALFYMYSVLLVDSFKNLSLRLRKRCQDSWPRAVDPEQLVI